jgi:hypothetical protein
MDPFQPRQYFYRDSRHAFNGQRFYVDPPVASVRPYIYAGLMILALIAAVML